MFAITNDIFADILFYFIESKILSSLGYNHFFPDIVLYLLHGIIPDQNYSEQSSELQTICESFQSDHSK